MILKITQEEFLERQKNFITKYTKKSIDAAIIFSPIDIFYLTGFHFSATERPICLIVDADQETHMFVPLLEEDHALDNAFVDHVVTYPEYPGERHPMEHLKDILKDLKLANKVIGLDARGYGSPMGYEGPAVEEVFAAKDYVLIPKLVEKMRMVKSDAEVALIEESCRWANLAHQLLQKYTYAGANEIDVVNKVRRDAGWAMIHTLGDRYIPHGQSAFAYYRGQIGKNSAYPHINKPNSIFKRGDTLVTAAGADVFGYGSELERIMFVDEVSPEQEKYFNIATEALELAIDTIKPGIPVSVIDETIRDFFKQENVLKYSLHHVGHALGISHHEAPFFDVGDSTIIEPNMIFTVEPGLYIKGFGGFRHSDTIVVTETGARKLTYYPTDLESLICHTR